MAPLDRLAGQVAGAGAIVKRLQELIEDAIVQKDIQCQNKKQVEAGRAKLKVLLGATCPLCEQPITQS